MVTRTQIDHANPQSVLGIVNSWKNASKDMLTRADTYRQAVTLPGGQPWSGQTRDSAVTMAGNDYTAIDHMHQAIDAMADTAANSINFTVIPALRAVRDKITAAENHQFRVNDDLSVTDTRNSDAPDPQRTQDRDNYEREIKQLAQKWWDADQAAADQINRDKQALAATFNGAHVPESPEQAEADVAAALAGDQTAATRVNAILDSITEDQKAGKVPLTPAQAAVLSQLQAQQHGMSKDALNTAEGKLGDQSRMIPNSWRLMTDDKLRFPKTPLTVGAKQGSEIVTGGFGQLPNSIQQVLRSQPGGEERAEAPWWNWTAQDLALTSATAVKAGVTDAVGRSVLNSADAGTGPGKASPSLLRWFDDPQVRGVSTGLSRVNALAAAVMAVPAAVADVHDGDSVPEAVTREAGGALAGIVAGTVAGAQIGGLAGTFIPIPGVGTAVGVVAGAAIGGVVATMTSKGIGEAWDAIFD